MASSAGPLGDLAAHAMRTLSKRQGRRAFHPYGVGFGAVLRPADRGLGVPGLQRGSAIVRLSRSLGLPEWLPDPCGVGLRIPDAHGPGHHQDLLMVSSGASPVARHLVAPARGFADRPYSTLLPYRLRGRLVVVCARVIGSAGAGPKLDELRRRSSADLELELAIAGLRGEWEPVARVLLGEQIADAETERMELDPGNTGGDLELAGLLNRVRVPSYRASQHGRAMKRN